MSEPEVTGIDPTAGIGGGEIIVRFAGVTPEHLARLEVRIYGETAHLVAVNTKPALAVVPDLVSGRPVEVSVMMDPETRSNESDVHLLIGRRVAGGLHLVTNPAFDPTDGSLCVTRSGSRGEHVPITIFRVATEGLEEFSADITNPTAMAFDRTARMFVTSRLDGTVYRITRNREAVA